jgi:hypothetical protein
MFMSEAAIEPAAILTRWLSQQQRRAAVAGTSGANSSSLAAWLEQLFPAAYELAVGQHAAPVPSTRFGLLENVLSQLWSATTGTASSSKREWVLGLARGLGFALAPEQRQAFVAQLLRWVCCGRLATLSQRNGMSMEPVAVTSTHGARALKLAPLPGLLAPTRHQAARATCCLCRPQKTRSPACWSSTNSSSSRVWLTAATAPAAPTTSSTG